MDYLTDQQVIEKSIQIVDAMLELKEVFYVDLMEYLNKKHKMFRKKHYKDVINCLLETGIIKFSDQPYIGNYYYDFLRPLLIFPDDILQALEQNVFSTGQELIRPTPEKAIILKLYLDEKYFVRYYQ